MPNLDPYGTPKHCIGCEHFAVDLAGGLHIPCWHGGRTQVQAQPEQGCVHWVRCMGADDEGPTRSAMRSRRYR